jgi:hypothetical protein
MARSEARDFGESAIVGDSGYPSKQHLMTPLVQTRTEAENLYNDSQIRTRNVVERSYGVWKRRFPGLALGIRLKLSITQAVVVATAVLHNIACEENENDPPITEEERIAIDLVNENPPDENNIRPNNNIMRQHLIHNYFGGL